MTPAVAAPRVSFIIPLYNCLGHTQAMLASLRASIPAGLAHEIILIDDGSSDGTREWLRAIASMEATRVLLNDSNQGYARANNRAAGEASGELLALLNNDLRLRPGWLEPMLAVHGQLGARAGLVGNIQRDAESGALDHAGIIVNAKAKPEHRRRLSWLDHFRRRLDVPAVTGACVLLSSALWRELGGFDQRYVNGCEDVDLCFRAAALGKVNAVALRSTVLHAISASPNRKARDEANAHRLALRWTERLAELARPAWTRAYFERYLPDPRDFPDPRLARQAALCRYGLRRGVPRRSAEGARAAMAIELARWEALERASLPCP